MEKFEVLNTSKRILSQPGTVTIEFFFDDLKEEITDLRFAPR